jgi:uncharacterized protein
MKLLLSPAKQMDIKHIREIKQKTKPIFLADSIDLINELKQKNLPELQKFLGISSKLTQINWERLQEWQPKPNTKNGIHAILGYKGEVYRNLVAETLSDDAISYLQKNALIFSGLYGFVKPLDFIMPYRLEMATPFAISKKKNLYEVWQQKLTEHLKNSTKENEVILNLTSEEYIKAIDTKQLNRKIIHFQFKTKKQGKLSNIMMHLKGGRGLMVRYCAENQIDSVDKLKTFAAGNFCFSEENSNESNLVFVKEI